MFKKSLIALALTVAATTSFAQVYIQGAAGQGTVNVDVTAPTTVKKTATGSKFALGYEYGNGWAVEGMIISFGKSVATTNTGTTGEMKATSFAIGGVYSGDLGNGHGLKVASITAVTKPTQVEMHSPQPKLTPNQLTLSMWALVIHTHLTKRRH